MSMRTPAAIFAGACCFLSIHIADCLSDGERPSTENTEPPVPEHCEGDPPGMHLLQTGLLVSQPAAGIGVPGSLTDIAEQIDSVADRIGDIATSVATAAANATARGLETLFVPVQAALNTYDALSDQVLRYAREARRTLQAHAGRNSSAQERLDGFEVVVMESLDGFLQEWGVVKGLVNTLASPVKTALNAVGLHQLSANVTGRLDAALDRADEFTHTLLGAGGNVIGVSHTTQSAVSQRLTQLNSSLALARTRMANFGHALDGAIGDVVMGIGLFANTTLWANEAEKLNEMYLPLTGKVTKSTKKCDQAIRELVSGMRLAMLDVEELSLALAEPSKNAARGRGPNGLWLFPWLCAAIPLLAR